MYYKYRFSWIKKKKLTSFIVVPHLPPQSFGYLHPGVEAWIKSPGSICKFISSKWGILTDQMLHF
jgi:hypothetical protein